MLQKTFNNNVHIEVKVKDLAGNYSDPVEIKIEDLKKEIETPEVTYTPAREQGKTNINVVAKIDFSNTNEEAIEFIQRENEITVEGLTAQMEIEENGTYTFYYKDNFGNQGSYTVEVDWIDKVVPIITVNTEEVGEVYKGASIRVQE